MYTHVLLPKRKSSAGLLIIAANNNWCLWFWISQHTPVCAPFILKCTRGAQTGSCLHSASPSRPRRCSEHCCLQRGRGFCPRQVPFSPTQVCSSLRQKSISSNISVGHYGFLLHVLAQVTPWGGAWLYTDHECLPRWQFCWIIQDTCQKLFGEFLSAKHHF